MLSRSSRRCMFSDNSSSSVSDVMSLSMEGNASTCIFSSSERSAYSDGIFSAFMAKVLVAVPRIECSSCMVGDCSGK